MNRASTRETGRRPGTLIGLSAARPRITSFPWSAKCEPALGPRSTIPWNEAWCAEPLRSVSVGCSGIVALGLVSERPPDYSPARLELSPLATALPPGPPPARSELTAFRGRFLAARGADPGTRQRRVIHVPPRRSFFPFVRSAAGKSPGPLRNKAKERRTDLHAPKRIRPTTHRPPGTGTGAAWMDRTVPLSVSCRPLASP